MTSSPVMTYYPIQQRWRKVGPIYRSAQATEIWYPEMLAFAAQRCLDYGFSFKPPKQLPDSPAYFDTCDWRFFRDKPGPAPAFWDYACHSACHWTANLSLFVAMQAEPDRAWRLVTSNSHTTVWDGQTTLWDTNFAALGVPADEAWELAANRPDSEHLEVSEFMWHDFPLEAIT